jgi:hypothetical protein
MHKAHHALTPKRAVSPCPSVRRGFRAAWRLFRTLSGVTFFRKKVTNEKNSNTSLLKKPQI